jgi:hypothetical protein
MFRNAVVRGATRADMPCCSTSAKGGHHRAASRHQLPEVSLLPVLPVGMPTPETRTRCALLVGITPGMRNRFLAHAESLRGTRCDPAFVDVSLSGTRASAALSGMWVAWTRSAPCGATTFRTRKAWSLLLTAASGDFLAACLPATAAASAS